MNEPLDMADWVERIRSAELDGVAAFRGVGLVGDLERLQDLQGRMPGAWVLPAQDTASARADQPLIHQRIQARVSVVLALRSYGDATGGRTIDELRRYRTALWQVLIGWQPPGAAFGIHYHSGRRLGPAKGAMWWEEQFIATYTMRK